MRPPIAFASLKHSFEKVGDHWEPKTEPGPSVAQDAKRGQEALYRDTPTASGVNANASSVHLFDMATLHPSIGLPMMSRSPDTMSISF